MDEGRRRRRRCTGVERNKFCTGWRTDLGGEGKKIAAEPGRGLVLSESTRTALEPALDPQVPRKVPCLRCAGAYLPRYPRLPPRRPWPQRRWFSTATARFLAASGPKGQRHRGTSAVAGMYLLVLLWRNGIALIANRYMPATWEHQCTGGAVGCTGTRFERKSFGSHVLSRGMEPVEEA